MALGSVEQFGETDNGNENEVRKDMRTNNSDGGKVKLSNLADLIHMCRDKGYQVYNDKPNIPASEEQRQKEQHENEGKNTNNKKHRADDPKSHRRYKLKESVMATRLSTKNYNKGDSTDQSSRRTSAKSSILDRSQMTSEMSYTTTSTERPNNSIDADEWHQIRMRKKSRKRREKNLESLVDVLMKKQEEIETNSTQRLNMAESKKQPDSTHEYQLNKENKSAEKTYEVFHGGSKDESNPAENSKQDAKNSDVVDDIKKRLDVVSDKLDNHEDDIEQTNHEHNKSNSERNEEIPEVRIKDGNKTLVLYRVRENTNTERHDENAQQPDKKSSNKYNKIVKETKDNIQHNTNNIDRKTDTNEDKSDPHIDERHTSPETPEIEKNENNSPRENAVPRNSNESVTKHSDKNVNILDEARIQDGNSTLVLYGVRKNMTSEQEATTKHKNAQETKASDGLNVRCSDTNMSSSDTNQVSTSHENCSEQKSISKSDSTVTHCREINNLHETLTKTESFPDLNEEHYSYNRQRDSSVLVNTEENDISYETHGININENGEKSTVVNHDRKSTVEENEDINNDESTSSSKKNVVSNSANSHSGETEHSEDLHKGETDKLSNELSSPMGTVKAKDTSMREVESNQSQDVGQRKNSETDESPGKIPKRSIGNGFLVSSDHEDENEANQFPDNVNEKRSKNIEKCEVDKLEHKSHKQKRQQLKNSERESIDSMDTTNKGPNTSETNNAGRTSTTSSKMMSLSQEARMILLFAKARQTNQQYGVDHLRTIDLLQEARLSLRRDFKNFKTGKEPEIEKSPGHDSEFYKKVYKDESIDLHEQVKAVKAAISAEQEAALKKTPHKDAEEREEIEAKLEAEVKEKQEEEKLQQDDNKFESEDDDETEPINVDINVGIVKSIKENASSRIDTKWDPKHPIFRKKSVRKKMLKNTSPTESVKSTKKNKVNNTSPIENVKSVKKNVVGNVSPTESVKKKKGKLDASDLPKENEYVREAKRIYPKGFTKYEKERKETGQAKNDEPMSTNENDCHHGGDSSPIETLNQSPKARQYINNGSPRHIDYRKIRYLKNDASNNMTNEPIRQTDKPQPIKTNGKPRLNPLKGKRRPRNEDNGDERLNIDRAFAKEYEAYMMYKSKSTQPANGKTTYQTNGNTSNANGKENFPNIVGNKNQDHAEVDDELKGITKGKSANEFSENDTPDRRRNTPVNDEDRHHVNDTEQNNEGSISDAIEVVKSRQKFYNDVSDESVKKEISRDSRVLKLFKQIQCIRRMAEPFSEMLPSDNENYAFRDPHSGFLFMNYGVSYETRQLKNRRSNSALNRFLHGDTDYEVCPKLKTLHVPYRRRDKALDVLKQKLLSRT